MAVSRSDLTSPRGDLNFEILTFHVRASRSRDSVEDRPTWKKIEKDETPEETIGCTLAYRHDDKTFAFVGEQWRDVKEKNDQGRSIFCL